MAFNILIADDSDSDRLLLKTIIQKLGHCAIEAANGTEALVAFVQHTPDIVLLDAMMPVMDGYDTARKMKQLSVERFVPIIFLTSLTEAALLAKCLEAGGDDFLTKPYNSVILKAKLEAFGRMIKMHQTMAQQRDQIALHNQHLIQEQEIAKKVFDKVAHAGCLHINNIEYHLSPLAVFNGDVLLAAVTPSGNIFVLLGDFTGHGLAAAIGAMPLAQTFYSMAAKGFSMTDIISEINLKLKEILPLGVFCCAAMIDMNMRDNSLEVWSGGLPDCFIYRAEDRSVETIASWNLPLGILDSKQFNKQSKTFAMQPGDRFYMWSDGILETVNANGDMFGQARIEHIFAAVEPESIFSRLLDSVNGFMASADQADDLSMLAITMVELEDFEGENDIPKGKHYQGPMDWGLSYDVRPDTLREYNPLPVLQQILMDIPGLRPHSGDIYMILSELYSNALEHGVLQLDSKMKACPEGFSEYYELRKQRLEQLDEAWIKFDLAYKGDDRSGCLTVTVIDSGEGFDYQAQLSQSGAQNYSGRGVALLKSLCQSVEFSQQGRQVTVSYLWSYDKSAELNLASD